MNQKIQIPEGCNAMIDYENRLVIIESKEKKQESKYKKGDIILEEYKGVKYLNILKGYRHADLRSLDFFIQYIMEDEDSDPYCDGWRFCHVEYSRLATPSEQQILFDALAKEGKYWDAEALEVKDLIKVPESIGIYKHKLQFDVFGDGLFISFNENKQVLGCCDGLYTVDIINDSFEKVQCYLQPCKREDLKVGDTALFKYVSGDDIDKNNRYCKIIYERTFATIKDDTEIVIGNRKDFIWYKLIPIK